MKLFLVFIACFLFTITGYGQQECGAVFNEKARQYFEDHRDEMLFYEQQFIQQSGRGIGVLSNIRIPIKAHVIRTTSGFGGLSVSDLNAAVVTMNQRYTGSGLEFFLCNGINYIDDDSYYDFDANDESILTSQNNETGMMNIYFANSVTSRSGSSLCGYAYYPGGPETVVMNNSCTTNGSTLSHEVGHFFGLRHTHGGTSRELVDGSNCSTEGDYICDTPADPRLSFNNVTSSCVYTGTDRDANGDLYRPDVTNIMSYSRKSCRTNLTTQQFARAFAAYQTTNRNNLSCPPEVADFTADVTSSCQPGLTVNFTDASANAISWAWDIDNDGFTDYTSQNVTHTYNAPGVYTVALTVSDGTITDTKIRNDYISVDNSTVLASSTLSLELTLDNYPEEISWDFTDGSGAVLYSGGPYLQGSDNGTTKFVTLTMASNDCYKFSIYDSFGDGLCCSYGNGSYRLLTSDGTTAAGGSVFQQTEVHNFATGTLSNTRIEAPQFSIHPNPAEDLLSIRSSVLPEMVSIYNTLGKVVYTAKITSVLDMDLDVTEYKAGIYFIRLTGKELGTQTESFIKR